MVDFWIVAQCSPVEVYSRLRGAYWLHHQGDENFQEFSEVVGVRPEGIGGKYL